MALAMAVIATVLAWPVAVRHLVVSHLEGLTHRTVRVDAVTVNPFTGRVAVSGLQLFEGDDEALFAAVARFDARVRPLALLRGHVSIADAVLEDPTVRIVRRADGLNVSDLFDRSGPSGVALDVTVDRFVVTRGTVTLEDRALREPRTWRSESIEIEARNLSTLRDDGRAVARSVTAGAPASLELTKVRLRPIHLEGVAKTTGFDLGLARLYFPPDAAVVLEQGRASSTLEVVLDAQEGVRATATGELADVVLVRPGEREPAAVLPKTALQLSELVYREDALSIGRLELTGSASVRDPAAGRRGRYQVSTLRASIADVTWPVTTPGRLDVESSVPGGGTMRLTGALRPPPAASQLRLLARSVDLAPWANLVPVKGRITGIATADLRIDEPLTPGVPNRVRGSVAVSRIGVADGRRELAGAERAELSDLEVRWPSRLSARRLVVQGPRATIERSAAGELPLRALFAPVGPAAPATATLGSDGVRTASAPAQASSPAPPSMVLAIGEVVVKDGRLAWRDEAVTPRAALDFAGIDASIAGAGWPLDHPLGIKAAARPLGGGQVQIAGRVGVEPISADLRVTVADAEIAPYQPYVPVPARIAGRTDLDVAVVLPSWPAEKATVRGRAAISRLDVRDGERSVVRAERVSASSLDVDWPRRLSVGDLAMQRPWVLIERAREGILPLRVLLSPRVGATDAARAPSSDAGSPSARGTVPGSVPVTIARLVVEDGGARLVDQRVSPPFALDMQRLEGQLEGVSTDPAAKPAQLALKGRVGGTSLLALRGTIGSFGGPLRVDVNGDLRGFAIPRTNPYLVQQVAWEAREGWLTTAIRCRIDGDALDARTEIQVSRLQLARADAGAGDQAQARVGLPLGMLVALMKDSRGDIRVTLPVSGRLSDPRFDFSEAIWSTIRNIAVKAIAAPVSWIGRVQFSADSRIERIDVDPIPFASGQAALTPEAREQLARVAAFLEQAPDVRMALTPIVSSRDRAALAEAGGSATPDLPALAARRLEAVRDGIKKAGVDAGRLKEVAASPAPSEGQGQVKLDLIEPENPGVPARPNLLKRLLGEAGSGARAVRN
jgi:outer membrane protein OmpA-like peptidoglycan-associated protein